MLLLSIRPPFLQAIYGRRKRFEFRRSAPQRHVPGLALFYETLPTGLITGVARISRVIPVDPREAAALAGPDDPFSAFYETYLAGGRAPCALALEAPEKLATPVTLRELTGLAKPPQSFCYAQVETSALNARLLPGSCHSIASPPAVG